MESELATLQEDGYHDFRRPFRERDLQIMSIVILLSIINLAINVPLFITAFYDLAFMLMFWSLLHVCLIGYSSIYIFEHGRTVYVPGSSQPMFVVYWVMLGIHWIKGYFFMDSSGLKLRSGLHIAAILFHLLSLSWLLLIGHALYWRYKFDSKYIIDDSDPEREMSTLSSCGLEHLMRRKQLAQCPMGSDPSQYIITHVNWWQERCFWKHQYVIVRAMVPRLGDSSARYFRVERHKTGWFTLSKENILDYILYSTVVEDLRHGSTLISDFEVTNLEEAVQSEYSIEMLGNLINIINAESPSYSLPSVNCWWFAGCIVERLAQRLGPSRMTSYRSVSLWEETEQEYTDLIKSCYLVYYDLHWPYWTLPCFAAIQLNTNYSKGFVVMVTSLVWVGIILQYWAVSSAWARVRNQFKDAGDDAPEFTFGLLYQLQQVRWQTLAAMIATIVLLSPLLSLVL
ncbi:hypothetical protein FRB93_005361 [Tulasnella sp. JGI-2019a]|nr:hypothetical protein FRB93_005361 [Tulasnella sp. JGI-2019a]